MARENIDIIREQFAAFNAGDVRAMMDPTAPDVMLVTDPRFPEGGTFTGVDEVERFFSGLREGWRDPHAILGEFRLVGDRVLVEGTWQGTGEASGIDVTSVWLVLYTFRDGKVISIRFFFDEAEALEAVGLAE